MSTPRSKSTTQSKLSLKCSIFKHSSRDASTTPCNTSIISTTKPRNVIKTKSIASSHQLRNTSLSTLLTLPPTALLHAISSSKFASKSTPNSSSSFQQTSTQTPSASIRQSTTSTKQDDNTSWNDDLMDISSRLHTEHLKSQQSQLQHHVLRQKNNNLVDTTHLLKQNAFSSKKFDFLQGPLSANFAALPLGRMYQSKKKEQYELEGLGGIDTSFLDLTNQYLTSQRSHIDQNNAFDDDQNFLPQFDEVIDRQFALDRISRKVLRFRRYVLNRHQQRRKLLTQRHISVLHSIRLSKSHSTHSPYPFSTNHSSQSNDFSNDDEFDSNDQEPGNLDQNLTLEATDLNALFNDLPNYPSKSFLQYDTTDSIISVIKTITISAQKCTPTPMEQLKMHPYRADELAINENGQSHVQNGDSDLDENTYTQNRQKMKDERDAVKKELQMAKEMNTFFVSKSIPWANKIHFAYQKHEYSHALRLFEFETMPILRTMCEKVWLCQNIVNSLLNSHQSNTTPLPHYIVPGTVEHFDYCINEITQKYPQFNDIIELILPPLTYSRFKTVQNQYHALLSGTFQQDCDYHNENDEFSTTTNIGTGLDVSINMTPKNRKIDQKLKKSPFYDFLQQNSSEKLSIEQKNELFEHYEIFLQKWAISPLFHYHPLLLPTSHDVNDSLSLHDAAFNQDKVPDQQAFSQKVKSAFGQLYKGNAAVSEFVALYKKYNISPEHQELLLEELEKDVFLIENEQRNEIGVKYEPLDSPLDISQHHSKTQQNDDLNSNDFKDDNFDEKNTLSLEYLSQFTSFSSFQPFSELIPRHNDNNTPLHPLYTHPYYQTLLECSQVAKFTLDLIEHCITTLQLDETTTHLPKMIQKKFNRIRSQYHQPYHTLQYDDLQSSLNLQLLNNNTSTNPNAKPKIPLEKQTSILFPSHPDTVDQVISWLHDELHHFKCIARQNSLEIYDFSTILQNHVFPNSSSFQLLSSTQHNFKSTDTNDMLLYRRQKTADELEKDTFEKFGATRNAMFRLLQDQVSSHSQDNLQYMDELYDAITKRYIYAQGGHLDESGIGIDVSGKRIFLPVSYSRSNFIAQKNRQHIASKDDNEDSTNEGTIETALEEMLLDDSNVGIFSFSRVFFTQLIYNDYVTQYHVGAKLFHQQQQELNKSQSMNTTNYLRDESQNTLTLSRSSSDPFSQSLPQNNLLSDQNFHTINKSSSNAKSSKMSKVVKIQSNMVFFPFTIQDPKMSLILSLSFAKVGLFAVSKQIITQHLRGSYLTDILQTSINTDSIAELRSNQTNTIFRHLSHRQFINGVLSGKHGHLVDQNGQNGMNDDENVLVNQHLAPYLINFSNKSPQAIISFLQNVKHSKHDEKDGNDNDIQRSILSTLAEKNDILRALEENTTLMNELQTEIDILSQNQKVEEIITAQFRHFDSVIDNYNNNMFKLRQEYINTVHSLQPHDTAGAPIQNQNQNENITNQPPFNSTLIESDTFEQKLQDAENFSASRSAQIEKMNRLNTRIVKLQKMIKNIHITGMKGSKFPNDDAEAQNNYGDDEEYNKLDEKLNDEIDLELETLAHNQGDDFFSTLDNDDESNDKDKNSYTDDHNDQTGPDGKNAEKSHKISPPHPIRTRRIFMSDFDPIQVQRKLHLLKVRFISLQQRHLLHNQFLLQKISTDSKLLRYLYSRPLSLSSHLILFTPASSTSSNNTLTLTNDTKNEKNETHSQINRFKIVLDHLQQANPPMELHTHALLLENGIAYDMNQTPLQNLTHSHDSKRHHFNDPPSQLTSLQSTKFPHDTSKYFKYYQNLSTEAHNSLILSNSSHFSLQPTPPSMLTYHFFTARRLFNFIRTFLSQSHYSLRQIGHQLLSKALLEGELMTQLKNSTTAMQILQSVTQTLLFSAQEAQRTAQTAALVCFDMHNALLRKSRKQLLRPNAPDSNQYNELDYNDMDDIDLSMHNARSELNTHNVIEINFDDFDPVSLLSNALLHIKNGSDYQYASEDMRKFNSTIEQHALSALSYLIIDPSIDIYSFTSQIDHKRLKSNQIDANLYSSEQDALFGADLSAVSPVLENWLDLHVSSHSSHISIIRRNSNSMESTSENLDENIPNNKIEHDQNDESSDEFMIPSHDDLISNIDLPSKTTKNGDSFPKNDPYDIVVLTHKDNEQNFPLLIPRQNFLQYVQNTISHILYTRESNKNHIVAQTHVQSHTDLISCVKEYLPLLERYLCLSTSVEFQESDKFGYNIKSDSLFKQKKGRFDVHLDNFHIHTLLKELDEINNIDMSLTLTPFKQIVNTMGIGIGNDTLKLMLGVDLSLTKDPIDTLPNLVSPDSSLSDAPLSKLTQNNQTNITIAQLRKMNKKLKWDHIDTGSDPSLFESMKIDNIDQNTTIFDPIYQTVGIHTPEHRNTMWKLVPFGHTWSLYPQFLQISATSTTTPTTFRNEELSFGIINDPTIYHPNHALHTFLQSSFGVEDLLDFVHPDKSSQTRHDSDNILHDDDGDNHLVLTQKDANIASNSSTHNNTQIVNRPNSLVEMLSITNAQQILLKSQHSDGNNTFNSKDVVRNQLVSIFDQLDQNNHKITISLPVFNHLLSYYINQRNRIKKIQSSLNDYGSFGNDDDTTNDTFDMVKKIITTAFSSQIPLVLQDITALQNANEAGENGFDRHTQLPHHLDSSSVSSYSLKQDLLTHYHQNEAIFNHQNESTQREEIYSPPPPSFDPISNYLTSFSSDFAEISQFTSIDANYCQLNLHHGAVDIVRKLQQDQLKAIPTQFNNILYPLSKEYWNQIVNAGRYSDKNAAFYTTKQYHKQSVDFLSAIFTTLLSTPDHITSFSPQKYRQELSNNVKRDIFGKSDPIGEKAQQNQAFVTQLVHTLFNIPQLDSIIFSRPDVTSQQLVPLIQPMFQTLFQQSQSTHRNRSMFLKIIPILHFATSSSQSPKNMLTQQDQHLIDAIGSHLSLLQGFGNSFLQNVNPTQKQLNPIIFDAIISTIVSNVFTTYKPTREHGISSQTANTSLNLAPNKIKPQYQANPLFGLHLSDLLQPYIFQHRHRDAIALLSNWDNAKETAINVFLQTLTSPLLNISSTTPFTTSSVSTETTDCHPEFINELSKLYVDLIKTQLPTKSTFLTNPAEFQALLDVIQNPYHIINYLQQDIQNHNIILHNSNHQVKSAQSSLDLHVPEQITIHTANAAGDVEQTPFDLITHFQLTPNTQNEPPMSFDELYHHITEMTSTRVKQTHYSSPQISMNSASLTYRLFSTVQKLSLNSHKQYVKGYKKNQKTYARHLFTSYHPNNDDITSTERNIKDNLLVQTIIDANDPIMNLFSQPFVLQDTSSKILNKRVVAYLLSTQIIPLLYRTKHIPNHFLRLQNDQIDEIDENGENGENGQNRNSSPKHGNQTPKNEADLALPYLLHTIDSTSSIDHKNDYFSPNSSFHFPPSSSPLLETSSFSRVQSLAKKLPPAHIPAYIAPAFKLLIRSITDNVDTQHHYYQDDDDDDDEMSETNFESDENHRVNRKSDHNGTSESPSHDHNTNNTMLDNTTILDTPMTISLTTIAKMYKHAPNNNFIHAVIDQFNVAKYQKLFHLLQYSLDTDDDTYNTQIGVDNDKHIIKSEENEESDKNDAKMGGPQITFQMDSKAAQLSSFLSKQGFFGVISIPHSNNYLDRIIVLDGTTHPQPHSLFFNQDFLNLQQSTSPHFPLYINAPQINQLSLLLHENPETNHNSIINENETILLINPARTPYYNTTISTFLTVYKFLEDYASDDKFAHKILHMKNGPEIAQIVDNFQRAIKTTHFIINPIDILQNLRPHSGIGTNQNESIDNLLSVDLSNLVDLVPFIQQCRIGQHIIQPEHKELLQTVQLDIHDPQLQSIYCSKKSKKTAKSGLESPPPFKSMDFDQKNAYLAKDHQIFNQVDHVFDSSTPIVTIDNTLPSISLDVTLTSPSLSPLQASSERIVTQLRSKCNDFSPNPFFATKALRSSINAFGKRQVITIYPLSSGSSMSTGFNTIDENLGKNQPADDSLGTNKSTNVYIAKINRDRVLTQTFSLVEQFFSSYLRQNSAKIDELDQYFGQNDATIPINTLPVSSSSSKQPLNAQHVKILLQHAFPLTHQSFNAQTLLKSITQVQTPLNHPSQLQQFISYLLLTISPLLNTNLPHFTLPLNTTRLQHVVGETLAILDEIIINYSKASQITYSLFHLRLTLLDLLFTLESPALLTTDSMQLRNMTLPSLLSLTENSQQIMTTQKSLKNMTEINFERHCILIGDTLHTLRHIKNYMNVLSSQQSQILSQLQSQAHHLPSSTSFTSPSYPSLTSSQAPLTHQIYSRPNQHNLSKSDLIFIPPTFPTHFHSLQQSLNTYTATLQYATHYLLTLTSKYHFTPISTHINELWDVMLSEFDIGYHPTHNIHSFQMNEKNTKNTFFPRFSIQTAYHPKKLHNDMQIVVKTTSKRENDEDYSSSDKSTNKISQNNSNFAHPNLQNDHNGSQMTKFDFNQDVDLLSIYKMTMQGQKHTNQDDYQTFVHSQLALGNFTKTYIISHSPILSSVSSSKHSVFDQNEPIVISDNQNTPHLSILQQFINSGLSLRLGYLGNDLPLPYRVLKSKYFAQQKLLKQQQQGQEEQHSQNNALSTLHATSKTLKILSSSHLIFKDIIVDAQGIILPDFNLIRSVNEVIFSKGSKIAYTITYHKDLVDRYLFLSKNTANGAENVQNIMKNTNNNPNDQNSFSSNDKNDQDDIIPSTPTISPQINIMSNIPTNITQSHIEFMNLYYFAKMNNIPLSPINQRTFQRLISMYKLSPLKQQSKARPDGLITLFGQVFKPPATTIASHGNTSVQGLTNYEQSPPLVENDTLNTFTEGDLKTTNLTPNTTGLATKVTEPSKANQLPQRPRKVSLNSDIYSILTTTSISTSVKLLLINELNETTNLTPFLAPQLAKKLTINRSRVGLGSLPCYYLLAEHSHLPFEDSINSNNMDTTEVQSVSSPIEDPSDPLQVHQSWLLQLSIKLATSPTTINSLIPPTPSTTIKSKTTPTNDKDVLVTTQPHFKQALSGQMGLIPIGAHSTLHFTKSNLKSISWHSISLQSFAQEQQLLLQTGQLSAYIGSVHVELMTMYQRRHKLDTITVSNPGKSTMLVENTQRASSNPNLSDDKKESMFKNVRFYNLDDEKDWVQFVGEKYTSVFTSLITSTTFVFTKSSPLHIKLSAEEVNTLTAQILTTYTNLLQVTLDQPLVDAQSIKILSRNPISDNNSPNLPKSKGKEKDDKFDKVYKKFASKNTHIISPSFWGSLQHWLISTSSKPESEAVTRSSILETSIPQKLDNSITPEHSDDSNDWSATIDFNNDISSQMKKLVLPSDSTLQGIPLHSQLNATTLMMLSTISTAYMSQQWNPLHITSLSKSITMADPVASMHHVHTLNAKLVEAMQPHVHDFNDFITNTSKLFQQSYENDKFYYPLAQLILTQLILENVGYTYLPPLSSMITPVSLKKQNNKSDKPQQAPKPKDNIGSATPQETILLPGTHTTYDGNSLQDRHHHLIAYFRHQILQINPSSSQQHQTSPSIPNQPHLNSVQYYLQPTVKQPHSVLLPSISSILTLAHLQINPTQLSPSTIHIPSQNNVIYQSPFKLFRKSNKKSSWIDIDTTINIDSLKNTFAPNSDKIVTSSPVLTTLHDLENYITFSANANNHVSTVSGPKTTQDNQAAPKLPNIPIVVPTHDHISLSNTLHFVRDLISMLDSLAESQIVLHNIISSPINFYSNSSTLHIQSSTAVLSPSTNLSPSSASSANPFPQITTPQLISGLSNQLSTHLLTPSQKQWKGFLKQTKFAILSPFFTNNITFKLLKFLSPITYLSLTEGEQQYKFNAATALNPLLSTLSINLINLTATQAATSIIALQLTKLLTQKANDNDSHTTNNLTNQHSSEQQQARALIKHQDNKLTSISLFQPHLLLTIAQNNILFDQFSTNIKSLIEINHTPLFGYNRFSTVSPPLHSSQSSQKTNEGIPQRNQSFKLLSAELDRIRVSTPSNFLPLRDTPSSTSQLPSLSIHNPHSLVSLITPLKFSLSAKKPASTAHLSSNYGDESIYNLSIPKASKDLLVSSHFALHNNYPNNVDIYTTKVFMPYSDTALVSSASDEPDDQDTSVDGMIATQIPLIATTLTTTLSAINSTLAAYNPLHITSHIHPSLTTNYNDQSDIMDLRAKELSLVKTAQLLSLFHANFVTMHLLSSQQSSSKVYQQSKETYGFEQIIPSNSPNRWREKINKNKASIPDSVFVSFIPNFASPAQTPQNRDLNTLHLAAQTAYTLSTTLATTPINSKSSLHFQLQSAQQLYSTNPLNEIISNNNLNDPILPTDPAHPVTLIHQHDNESIFNKTHTSVLSTIVYPYNVLHTLSNVSHHSPIVLSKKEHYIQSQPKPKPNLMAQFQFIPTKPLPIIASPADFLDLQNNSSIPSFAQTFFAQLLTTLQTERFISQSQSHSLLLSTQLSHPPQNNTITIPNQLHNDYLQLSTTEYILRTYLNSAQSLLQFNQFFAAKKALTYAAVLSQKSVYKDRYTQFMGKMATIDPTFATNGTQSIHRHVSSLHNDFHDFDPNSTSFDTNDIYTIFVKQFNSISPAGSNHDSFDVASLQDTEPAQLIDKLRQLYVVSNKTLTIKSIHTTPFDNKNDPNAQNNQILIEQANVIGLLEKSLFLPLSSSPFDYSGVISADFLHQSPQPLSSQPLSSQPLSSTKASFSNLFHCQHHTNSNNILFRGSALELYTHAIASQIGGRACTNAKNLLATSKSTTHHQASVDVHTSYSNGFASALSQTLDSSSTIPAIYTSPWIHPILRLNTLTPGSLEDIVTNITSTPSPMLSIQLIENLFFQYAVDSKLSHNTTASRLKSYMKWVNLEKPNLASLHASTNQSQAKKQ